MSFFDEQQEHVCLSPFRPLFHSIALIPLFRMNEVWIQRLIQAIQIE